MVKRAVYSQIEQIILLDESVIGSRCRENMIREAVEKGQCYIIEAGEAVAAFGILSRHFYDNYFIELLIVGEVYRRIGYGRMMLGFFKELCRPDKLFTSTNNSNLPMQKLLERCSFVRCGWIDCLDEGDPEVIYCFEKNQGNSDPLHEIRSFNRDIAAESDFSGAVHFSQPGKAAVEEAFGYANRGWNVQNNTLTRFNTTSISKIFTACGIVKLVEQGALGINDRLCDYLQFDNNPFSENITLYHLLTHTSGIADDADEEAGENYEDIFINKPNYRFRKASDLVENFIGKKPVFDPGSSCRYNNAGYVLLGLVIEKVTGIEYTQWIMENILIPWGLNSTFFPSMDEVNSNTAEGYISMQDGEQTIWKKNIYSITPVGTPEGGIYSNAADLSHMMRGLVDGKYFAHEYTQMLLTPKALHTDYGNIQHMMGFGFEFIMEGERIVYFKKDGSNPGVSAVMVYYPDSGTSLVILSNQNCNVWDMHHKIDEKFGLSKDKGRGRV